MSRSLPLVHLPSRTAIHRFGTPSTAPRSSALLRFEQGLTIPKDGRQGWAIVGDGEGRRLAVEVCFIVSCITVIDLATDQT